jgi:hypothetical protein
MEIKVERISRNTDTVRSDIKEESEGKTRTKTYANTQCKHTMQTHNANTYNSFLFRSE